MVLAAGSHPVLVDCVQPGSGAAAEVGACTLYAADAQAVGGVPRRRGFPYAQAVGAARADLTRDGEGRHHDRGYAVRRSPRHRLDRAAADVEGASGPGQGDPRLQHHLPADGQERFHDG